MRTEANPGRIPVALLPAALLAAAVLLLYARSVGFGWSGWDDLIYVAWNPVLDEPFPRAVARILRPGGVPQEILYIPLTYLSHLVEVSIFGKSPAALHAVNVALHLANVLLAYALLLRLSGRRWLSFVGALAFAGHPLQAEAVAWIMGRKDLLATLFALVGLHAWLRLDGPGGRRSFWIAVAAWSLAVFAKPTVLVLPGVLLLLDLRAGRRPLGGRRAGWLPFLVVAALALYLDSRVPRAEIPSLHPGWFRLLCAPWLGWHWLSRLFLLERPIPLYAWPAVETWPSVLARGLAFLGVLCALLAFWRRKRLPWLGPGLAMVGILFLPAASVLLGPKNFVTADRYGYFPLIAVFGLLAAAPLAAAPRIRRIVAGGIGVWLLAALALAWPAVSLWGDDIGIWDRVLTGSPDQVSARVNRGNALARRGRFAEAAEEFERVLRLVPDEVNIHESLVRCRLDGGETDRAASALLDLAEIHLGAGNEEAAMAAMGRAAALPARQRVDVLVRIASTCLSWGWLDEARRAVDEALRLDPKHAGARDLRSRLLR